MKDAKLEAFVVYVWKRRADGRIPIHACCLPKGTDMMFDPDWKKVRAFVKGTKEGIGVTRREYRSVFYVYKKPPEGATVLTADD